MSDSVTATYGEYRDIVVLGSTGAIGTTAIDVITRNPQRFNVVGLAAGGRRIPLLVRQALSLGVRTIAVADPGRVPELRDALRHGVDSYGGERVGVRMPTIISGPGAAAELASIDCHAVINCVAGTAGLPVTMAALAAGRTVVLANSESLTSGAPLLRAPGQIVPVHQVHSALARCLRDGRSDDVHRLVITASGGPFRGFDRDRLADVTPAQALAHRAGRPGLAAVNSATLVHEALAVVEANLLFGIDIDRIDVLVHPQSVVHSMVEFADGSTVAQAGPPDMRVPLALALGWPDRVLSGVPRHDWTGGAGWDFHPVDDVAFPAVVSARRVGRAGGTAPAAYDAANAACVEAFLAGRIRFTDIVDTVNDVLAEHDAVGRREAVSLCDVLGVREWARRRAGELVGRR